MTNLTAQPNAAPSIAPPVGLLAELTHRCPLKCLYCSNPLELDQTERELSTEHWLDIFRQATELGVLQLHLSGGEPTTRKDLDILVAGAARAGLYTNLITAGLSLSRDRVHRLAKAGLDHVQISVQDTREDRLQAVSGYRGSLKRKLGAAASVRDAGLALTINAPVHRGNLNRLPEFIDLAVALGAERLEIAHVQYHGWALINRATLMPTRDQVERSVEVVNTARNRLRGVLVIDFVVPDYYAVVPKPCMGGWGRKFIVVTPSGQILPCHAAQSIPGLEFDNVRERTLRGTWFQGSAFRAFRGTAWMKEPCASCPRRDIDFGGCRCQALILTGDACNADPVCELSPHHAELSTIISRGADKKTAARHYRTARVAVRLD
jgi:PqqA peptide cyclase